MYLTPCLSAMESKLPRVDTAALDAKLKADYISRWKGLKLTTDPLSPSFKWNSEDITLWPSIDLPQIFLYYIEKTGEGYSVLGQYKEQKAYSYWASGFVDKLEAHRLKDKRILIKGSVSPSQRVRDDDRKVWLLFQPDGVVLGGWCTCTAGYGETCNHTMAVMYKLEYASSLGYNKPSCTSMPSKWNCQTKRIVAPVRAKDMVVRKDTRTKGNTGCDPVSTINTVPKLEFDPRRENQRSIDQTAVSTFLQRMHDLRPSCNLFKGLPKQLTAGTIPDPVPVMAREFYENKGTTDGFLEYLADRITSEDIVKVKNESPLSEVWVEQRKGRVTASCFQEVGSRMSSVVKGRKGVTVLNLVAKLMGHAADISGLDPVAYGREKEKEGKLAFIRLYGPRHNNTLALSDTGLVIMEGMPVLAATPDSMVSCSCCEPAVLEVKCPYNIQNEKVSDAWDRTDYLTKNSDGVISLKHSHKYYAQIQGQMAITKVSHGYFIVWTPSEPLVIPIKFDLPYWNDLQERLVMFYKMFMLKYVSGAESLFFCSMCSQLCLEPDEIASREEGSVQCDACSLWCHMKCIPNWDTVDFNQEWFCPLCK